jgi:trans-aconitate methyltransferase
MSKAQYVAAKKRIEIKGDIYVPEGLQSDPRFILPDEIVTYCSSRFDLARAGKRGIDPMCGVGTIPRVITARGGHCDAAEIDPHQYAVARKELPPRVSVTLGDCMTLRPAQLYDFIYTSVPFVWFEHYPEGLTSNLAAAFRRMLKPGGMLIIDTDEIAKRDGRSWHVASAQVAYFTENGFQFDEAIHFAATSHQGVGDTTFTELVFTGPYA